MHLSQFEQNLQNICMKKSSSVAFPESHDQRVFLAAMYLAQTKSIERIYLFLSKEEYLEYLKKWTDIGIDEVNSQIFLIKEHFPSIEKDTEKFIRDKYHKREKKIDEDELLIKSKDTLFQAGFLLNSCNIDSVIAGVMRTTSDVIKAGLITVGLAKECSTLSGSFIMTKSLKDEEALYIFADCGVTIQPSAAQLSEIAWQSVRTLNSLACQQSPKVAFLSFSTKGSAKHPSAEKMIEAYKIFSQKYPAVISDGELQFDASIDEMICRRKAPHSKLKGEANIFIFPNLDAANIAYKITQRLANFEAYGPILQGMAKPFSDLSRGASIKDVVISTYINICRGSGDI